MTRPCNNKTTELLELLTEEQREALRAKRVSPPLRGPVDVAIIGLSGRYPQSDDHYEFWQKLQNGFNFIEEVPQNRWNHGLYFHPGMGRSFVAHQTRCKFGSFVSRHDAFDAEFFGIKPDEVPAIDPQERLALETTWSCIEDAGYVPKQLGESTGIFSGLTYSDYQKLIPLSTHLCMLNARIAYFFNFRGPSITCDTGCSSSLSAIHLACESLQKGDCRTALVVGANLLLHPDHYTSASPQLSNTLDPRSNPFGTDDGWIPAEAVVSVLLKSLPQAVNDGDQIYAVIKSTHIGQEGKTSWFSAPSPKRQAALIGENFEKIGISPQTISYVEAAANGSALGDAIEFEGMSATFAQATEKKQFCPIGSVKSNVGHAEGVSTLVQLTKVVMQFRSETLVPLINLNQTNPNIAVEGSPFYFETSQRRWQPPRLNVNGHEFVLPRRATISSSGAGGNFGHLILEEHDFRAPQTVAPEEFYFPLSSSSSEQLLETVSSYLRFFESHWMMDARKEARYTALNLMFTLCMGRTPLRERVVFRAGCLDELRARFRDFLGGERHPGVIRTSGRVGRPRDPSESVRLRAWREVAECWAEGAEVDWNSFFESYVPQRVSLPTYRFRREHFPIPKPGVLSSGQQLVSATQEPERTQICDNAAEARFKMILAACVSLRVEEIDASTPLDSYGFDSTMVVKLARELEAHFPPIPKTLFFECATLSELIDALSRKFPIEFRKLNGSADADASVMATTEPARRVPESAPRSRDIAIIGLAGRYPGATTIREFWNNLRAGRDSISEIPADRWAWRDYFCPDVKEAVAAGKTYSKWGGFLDDVDKFDSMFFGITPREAEIMDPQERIFLEVAWSALEDSGYTPASLNAATAGKVGVYVGVSWQEYQSFSGLGPANEKTCFLNHAGTIANRVSHICHFEGASLTTDTACSSALTAVHLACSSLIDGANAVALAGGVNLSLLPDKFVALSSVGMISSKGRCESFGEGGDGYAPGEGVGCVVLKPLAAATADGDHIYGVIKGSAVNHSGKTNGYSVPNPESQARVIEQALGVAGMNPRTVGCIEAHGTGTSLGDPIEVHGLTKAFSHYTDAKQFCAIGSVKSNIGHAESAAGIAGLTKALLQLQHGEIAPSLHSEIINGEIDFSKTPFFVQRELAPWKRMVVDGQTVPRRVGISSFGAGGANAHLIVEEHIPAIDTILPAFPQRSALIVLSAKTAERLDNVVRNLLAFLKDKAPDVSLESLAFTLQVGRQPMPERMAFAVTSLEELMSTLELIVNGSGHESRVLRARAVRKSNSGEALENAWDAWETASRGDELLRLWVSGVEVEWNRLYNRPKPRRVSLPTYPFARERHWVDGSSAKSYVEQAGAPGAEIGTLLCEWVWKESPASADGPAPTFRERLIFICEVESPTPLPGSHCVKFERDGRSLADTFQAHAIRIFEEIRARFRKTGGEKTLVQVVFPCAGEGRVHRGILGLLHTAQMENPNFVGQLIEVDPEIGPAELKAALSESGARPEHVHVRYRDGKRFVAVWEEAVSPKAGGRLPWKDGGVYLVTGGAGGLGLVFATEIATRARFAKLVLAGRSESSPAISQQLDQIASLGATVEYAQVDVSDAEAVNELVRRIVQRHGSLTGVIHSAGIIRDSLIQNKTAEDMRAVLAAKVAGTLHLDAATRDIPLDFFALFSSVAGALGNVGQADYATANAFLDVFAEHRNDLVAGSLRRGLTVSINWPLWEKGGMTVDDATKTRMTESSGLMAMGTRTGIEAFEKALAMGCAQVLVLFGDLAKIRAKLSERAALDAGSNTETRPGADGGVCDELLLDRVQERLCALFSEVTKIPIERIVVQEPLESYGIDSIIITRLNRELERVFKEVSQTLFFECLTLAGVARYFLARNVRECMAWTGMSDRQATPSTVASPSPAGVSNRTSVARRDEPIAIVGLSGRYAGADNLDLFWDHLRSGRDCVTEIPPDRWPMDGFYNPNSEEAIERGISYSKWGSFLDGFADFDPLFFNISPLEAMSMDPQERLFLQAAWEAIEDSGYTREALARRFDSRVGVFVGITKTGFDLYRLEKSRAPKGARPRTSFSSVANRISYVMNLRGPSMPIDTMCSSSLTAIHEACEHLRSGDCEMALAGGVNLYLHPTTYFDLCASQMLSPDGRCRSFGAGANGFVPGEGVGAILLKPLSRAIADRDSIHALIRSTSVNHGGKTNGYTVPNPMAQAALIRDALDKAGVHARTISYVEAHGTGTDLGDPIEIAGLSQAFRKDTEDAGFCALGSLKSNLGHLEAAAGIAGLTKIILQMKHQALAPTLHARELNPKIPFAGTPFLVQQDLAEWKRPALNLDGDFRTYPRIAGISSFGAGGSNAHVIVEEHISEPERARSNNQPALIVLSAKNEERLKAVCENLYAWLLRHPSELADVAYTLQVGREPMEERLAFVAESSDELTSALSAFIRQEDGPVRIYRGNPQRRSESLTLLSRDPDLGAAVRLWVAKRQYSKLLKLWVEGFEPDWESVYGAVNPRRISLPAYPFAKQRFWFNGEQKNETGVPVSPLMETKGRLHDLVVSRLNAMLEELVALPASRIESDTPLHQYGVDSVIMARFSSRLGAVLGTLPPTLLYEYPTVGSLAEHLCTKYAAGCKSWTGLDDSPVPARSSPGIATAPSAAACNDRADPREPIAIIGMSGRFAQSDSLGAFWENLVAGKNCITEVPKDRWPLDGFFESDPRHAIENGMSYGKWGGFVSRIDEFDPLFFNISPREGIEMDPQQRLFLEECWRAFEDAGYRPSRLDPGVRKRFGVFGGITQIGDGTSAASLVNRVSHALDLQGPSVPVDTMCSSSLVALHLACEGLRRREIDAALVGAVNLYVQSNSYRKLSRSRMLSESATPAVFGRGGTGFTPSEGVAATVLKRLSDAVRDGDNILAIVRSSAMNHNGKAMGYTVPNPRQQEDVVRRALEYANVDPRTIGYIESAANGSETGDAIEMAALANVFRPCRDNGNGPYRIGSLKSTMGHGEAVSGMAQLMKVVLQLRHDMLCPTPFPADPNPRIDFTTLPFSVQTEAETWPRILIGDRPAPRRAGISSTGAGGVNAHVIVEEYPAAATEPSQGPHIFVLSARSARVLDDYLETWKNYLALHPDLDFARAAYTLQTGREPMKFRFGCVVSSALELFRFIESAQAGQETTGVWFNGGTGQADPKPDEFTSWIKSGELDKLARAWVSGAEVPWELLYRSGRPAPLHGLPTYPFGRRSYRAIPTREEAPVPNRAARFIPLADDDGWDPKQHTKANERPRLFTPDPASQNHNRGTAAEIGEVRRAVRRVLSEVLYLDEQDDANDDDNFFEVGLNSLSIVSFIQGLNRVLKLNLRETIAFDHPSINALSKHIVSSARPNHLTARTFI